MHLGQSWHRAFHRFMASPSLEVLGAAAVVSVALYAMFNTDAIYQSPHMPVMFGHR